MAHRFAVLVLIALGTLTALATAPIAAAARPARHAPGGTLGSSTDTKTSTAVTLDGAGANSIYPFFQRVFYDYSKKDPKTTINFSPAGSSVGISDIQQDTVDFGDSEIPMSPTDLAKAKSSQILQVPVDLGGVAISYNLPSVTQRLRLDGPTLAEIFDGTITNWDDPRIAAVSGVSNLPNLAIVPVHRADSSGPSWDLDDYLIKTGKTWAKRIGTSTPSRSWPLASVGVGEQLNTGVAAYVKQTPGAIGFLEYGYALESGFKSIAVKNRSGAFVTPSEKSIAEAGSHAGKLSPTNFSIINEPGTGTYPLANFSWTLLYRKQASTTTGIALGKLFYYVVTQGQKLAGKLGYAPLPANVSVIAIRTIERLEAPSGTLLFSH